MAVDEESQRILAYSSDDEDQRPWYAANKTFLPVKLVYFIYIAALAVVRPYTPLFMFELGLNTFQVGILRCLEPMTSFLTSPVWGSVADKFNVHRTMMIFAAVGSSVVIPLFLLVPPVDFFQPVSLNESDWRTQMSRASIDVDRRIADVNEGIFPWFSLVTFSLLFVLMLVNNTFIAGFIPLLDASTVELCKKYPGNSYGGQRWPGAFAVIVFSPVAGLMVDLYSSIERQVSPPWYFLHNHYLISFSMLTILSVLSIIPLMQMEMISKRSPKSFSREVIELFKSPDVTMTFLLILVVGVCKGIVGAFLFIFLGELGATKFLMGATLIVTCSTEVPCLIWSKAVIDKLGCPAVFLLGLIAYVIRLLAYSLITTSWQVLPVETLHGVCYGVLWANCTEYANRIAPDGMAATLQSLMHATKAGIGTYVKIRQRACIHRDVMSVSTEDPCIGSKRQAHHLHTDDAQPKICQPVE